MSEEKDEKIISPKNFLEILEDDKGKIEKAIENTQEKQEKIKNEVIKFMMEKFGELKLDQDFLEESRWSQKRNNGLIELIKGLVETKILPSIKEIKKRDDFLVRLEGNAPYCFYYLISSEGLIFDIDRGYVLLSGNLIFSDEEDLKEDQVLSQFCVCGNDHVIVVKICVEFTIYPDETLQNRTKVSLWLPCYRRGAQKVGSSYVTPISEDSLTSLLKGSRIAIGHKG